MLEEDFEEQMDGLIDDATHAANNLIPNKTLERLSADERSNLLVQLNDAISLVFKEFIEPDDLEPSEAYAKYEETGDERLRTVM